MTPTTSQNNFRIVGAIIILSVVLRVAMALYLGNTIEDVRGGTYDQFSYDMLAQRVAGGHGFSFASDWWPVVRAGQPTAFWSYLYTLFLAALYFVFGHDPLTARLIQVVLVGIAMPWLIYRIGQRIFGRRPALFAAGISAVYLYFITYAASLMTEAFYIVGILWIADVTMRLTKACSDQTRSMHRLWLGIELGLAMGMTLLMRQVISAFLVVLAFWFVWVAWRNRWLRQLIGPLIASALMVGVIILPFVVHNYQLFGVVGMPNTNVGINFFWANHPIYGTRFEAVLSPSHGVTYQDLIPLELRNQNEALMDRALLARGLQFVVDDPGRYLLLSLSRIPIYFQFWPTADSTTLSNVARLLSFGLFLPFMLYGLIIAIRDARPRGPLHPSHASQANIRDLRLTFLKLVWLFMVVYSLLHLATWANVRYRLPVDAFWILFAGYGIDNLLQRLRHRAYRHQGTSHRLPSNQA